MTKVRIFEITGNLRVDALVDMVSWVVESACDEVETKPWDTSGKKYVLMGLPQSTGGDWTMHK